MKKFDLVKLTNAEPYIKYDLQKSDIGIIIKIEDKDSCDLMFYNPKNIGDHAIIRVKNSDFEIENFHLPQQIQEELAEKLASKDFEYKDKFEPNLINDYDKVELIVEKEKYAQDGIHKGAIGCVMDSNAVGDYVLVDFSWVDENGNYFGDCILAKISDLKVLE